ncbi:MAG: DUF565 domain-containing protein [Hydrococcus sp. C42_A2020_068]|uniref:DUF565 domain-containing protein n=1 Tax=Hydrococcus rivularis NIES-593 TaxID=1921803 RepID=A0A1U7HCX3_9CYAN|nr:MULTISPECIES: DUF565 domain-containing protein [Pleurocapsales]AFY76415.1 Protein of unknown function (DUF565) [Pleurocapsa sp. PCC 7327]MBF2018780.1 DUF565 domain-containing protein [Hydrococcus sp. C42_A2020_068]OKH21452.1 hypothetical protein NIES593_15780 [Hydrococcus rivularis NIES-593]
MQRTRLNTLADVALTRIDRFFSNPWRRISLILIGVLFGFFAGSALSTTAGQAAEWDIIAAGFVLLFVEFVSRIFYRRERRSLFLEVLNFFKIGMIYSLFLEAFKLGS